MQERITALLEHENLSPSKFADLIGVQRSSVSHVISGRNKPSFDFLQKTLRAFPGLRADWLMLGEGNMYIDQEEREMDLFGPDMNQQGTHEAPIMTPAADPESLSKVVPTGKSELKGKVKRVMIFYEDESFSVHFPSE